MKKNILALVSMLTLMTGCQPAPTPLPPISTAVPPTAVSPTLVSRPTTPLAPAQPTLVATPILTLLPSPSPSSLPARVFLIDTDMATDDWMAILYLLRRSDVSVKAITVAGTGEAHCGPGIRNALGLLALARYDNIPVACGRETPLGGNHTFPTSWRERVDNLYGLKLPLTPNRIANQTSVQLLTSTIQSSSQKVILLTLGPLTNIAEALQNAPTLVDKIEMIYIMGGAVDVPGNIALSGVGIDNKRAEWNIYVDPHAANVVLKSKAPITLVPLDATNHAPLTPSFFERLRKEHTTLEATFIFDLLTNIQSMIQSGTYYFWDPLAAAISTEPSMATIETREICVVEEEGPESGRMKTADSCPKVQVSISANGQRFEQIFLNTLNGLPR